jgi:hypothetical protein
MTDRFTRRLAFSENKGFGAFLAVFPQAGLVVFSGGKDVVKLSDDELLLCGA